MDRGYVLQPDLLVLPDRAAVDRVTNNRAAVDVLQLEPVLDPQLIRPDHSESPGGTRAIELFPEHRSRLVPAMS